MWTDPEFFEEFVGIHGGLCNMVKEAAPNASGGLEQHLAHFPGYERKMEALDDIEACQGWNVRVTGIFWIIGMTPGDTYLVPDAKRDVVYLCCGMRDPLYPKVEHFGRPVLFYITMMP